MQHTLFMALDWTGYDEYFDTPRSQLKIDGLTKKEVEALCAEILSLPLSLVDAPIVWGACSPPGVSAQTVVRVPGSVPHRFSSESGAKPIGVKIFKSEKGAGAPRQADVIGAHSSLRPRIPGLPNPLVQEVYFAGRLRNRFYLVQEWIEGESLGSVLSRGDCLSFEEVREWLRDLFEGILIPLWSLGTIWWDIRGDNYCLTPVGERRRLVMIDTDSVLAYATEIVEAPEIFLNRDRVKKTAMRRVKTMAEHLVYAPLRTRTLGTGDKKQIKNQFEVLWKDLEAVFLKPGRLLGGTEAFGAVLAGLEGKIWKTKLASEPGPKPR